MTRTTFTKITPNDIYLLVSVIQSTCFLKMKTGFRMPDTLLADAVYEIEKI